VLLVLILLSYYVQWQWLLPNVGAEADATCYLLTAKNLATHGDAAHLSPDPAVFVPEHMVEVRPGVFYPIYPIGYPALCALAYLGQGPAGPFYINPALVAIGLAGAFGLARLFVRDLFAVAATAFLAVHPTLLYYGVIAMSHAAEFALATWCLYCLAAWLRRPRAGLLISGAVLVSAATTVRYTGALLGLPLVYVVLARLLQARRAPEEGDTEVAPPRRILVHAGLAAVAGLLAIVPLMAHLNHAFGSPFTTGYSLSGEAGAFSLAHFGRHFPYALKALSQLPLGLSVLFPLALAGMGIALRRDPRVGGFMAVATLPTLLLYGAYYWFIADPTPWWQPYSLGSLLYLRFFLGVFPMLVIAALWFVERLLDRREAKSQVRSEDPVFPRGHAIVAGLVVLLGVTNLLLFPPWRSFFGTAVHDALSMELVLDNVPPDAVIVADGFTTYSLIYETNATVYYPRYFAKPWVDLHIAPATATRPADYDPLRRKRFADLLAGRTDSQLFDLLRDRLVEHARRGQSVWLLVEVTPDPWYGPLGETFEATPVAGEQVTNVALLRLTLRNPPPATGIPAATQPH
jgi:hypothetical protein